MLYSVHASRVRMVEDVDADAFAGELRNRGELCDQGASRGRRIGRQRAERELDPHRVRAPDGAARAGRPAPVGVGIVDAGRAGIGRRHGPERPACFAAAGQRLRHRHLTDGIFGERHSDRVANPVFQQRSDSDRALDASVFAIARLGHTHMERVGRGAGGARLESSREQTIGLDRDLGIARLHAEHDVAVALGFAHIEELERALHHAAGRVAVAVHDAVRERAVVRADTQGAAELLQPPHEGTEALRHTFELLGVLSVRVLPNLELLLVGVVARVDPHLLDVLGSRHGRTGREVDVGHERHANAPALELGANRPQILGVLRRGRGDPDDLAAGFYEPLGLVGGARSVEGIRRRHRLDADRVVAAKSHVADPDHTRDAPAGGEDVCDVGGQIHWLTLANSRFEPREGLVELGRIVAAGLCEIGAAATLAADDAGCGAHQIAGLEAGHEVWGHAEGE